MQKIIDLDKLVKKIDDLYYRSIVAFYNDKPVKSVPPDLNSINESLDNYTKIFIQFGCFIYEDSKFIFDDPYVIEGLKYNENFNKSQISIIISTSQNLNDEYYDKYKYPVNYDVYKYPVAGYGIYLDNNLNVEYGYITAHLTGNLINSTHADITYHDFNDARDGDRIKEHICSLINRADIWKTDDTPLVRKTDDVVIRGGRDQEVILKFLYNLKTEVLYFVNGKYFEIKQYEDILKELNEENYFIHDPIAAIPNIVLLGGGKLIFKFTDDVGLQAYMKAENSQSVLYVRKYPYDEEEVLFDKKEDKESDEDIYPNIHEFKPKFTSISDVYSSLKGKKINLEETIRRVGSIDMAYEGEDIWTVFAGGAIYIRAVYASEEVNSGGEIYEYEIDADAFETVGILSGLGNYDLRLNPQYYTGDEAGDYGIVIDDDGEISFYENRSGICGGLHEACDLSEPLNAFVIEIMMNMLVFENPLDESDEVVLYCPDCGEAYQNGKELCPDCGTKLVTEFEITMLEYKGLL